MTFPQHGPLHSVKAIKSRGFNLIEAAIVLGVVGLVIGGIWVAAASVMENLKFNRLMAGFQKVTLGVQDAFPASFYDKATPAFSNYVYLEHYVYGHTLSDMGIIPADWNSNPPYPTSFIVYARNSYEFQIDISLPLSACRKFIARIASAPTYNGGSVSPNGRMWGSSTTLHSISYRQNGCIDGTNVINSKFLFTR